MRQAFCIWTLFVCAMPVWVEAAGLPTARETVMQRRPASGNLLIPALRADGYEARVHAAVLGWAMGAALSQDRYLGEPKSPVQFPLLLSPGRALVPLGLPPLAIPHSIYPIETLLQQDHEPTPEDYLATWSRHGVSLPGAAAAAIKSGTPSKDEEGTALFTGALMLGLASPGMPDLAAARAYDAYVFAYPEESLVAAMFVAAMASTACIDKDWLHIWNSAIAELPRDSVVRTAVDYLKGMEGRYVPFRFEAERLHRRMSRTLSWTDPVLNLSALLIAMDYGYGDAKTTLRYSLALGYDAPVNSGVLMGLVGARSGLDAFPEQWNAIRAKGIHLKVRNIPSLRIRRWADIVDEASRTVEIPFEDLSRRIAEIGRKSLQDNGGRWMGDHPDDVLILPFQEHIQTNLRQMKAALGNQEDRPVKNTPVADQVELAYKALLEPATSLDVQLYSRELLQLSSLAGRSRNKVIGHDAVRICTDWHRMFSQAGAGLAGWTIFARVKPSRLARGDSAEIELELRNQGEKAIDSVSIDLKAGNNSGLALQQAWQPNALGRGGVAQTSYALTVAKDARLAPHPFKAEIRIKNGTEEYLLLGDVSARVVSPVNWDARLSWKGEALQIVEVTLMGDPVETARNVTVICNRMPDGVTVEPSVAQKPLKDEQGNVAGFRVVGATSLLHHAWSAYGLEIRCGSEILSSTHVLPTGPIRQVDGEFAVPIRDEVDGRRAYRMDPKFGVLGLNYEVNNAEFGLEDGPLKMAVSYYSDEKKERSLIVSYRTRDRQSAEKTVPLHAEKGWNFAEVELGDIALGKTSTRISLRMEDKEAIVIGRIIPVFDRKTN